MRPALVLAGAGVASALLTAAAVISVMQDPEIRDCTAALADVQAANDAHEGSLSSLERLATPRSQRGRAPEAEVDEARRHTDRTKHEFDAARDEVTRLCNYPPHPSTPASIPRELP